MSCNASWIVVLLVSCSGVVWADDRPHIVFVLADDLGPGDLGCSGGRLAPTPNLDRLAREGTRFTQYYAAAPICSPSRAGLITGQFPARWRITSYLQTRAGNRACLQADYLDADAPSLPRLLQRAGYATAHVGKWHLGGGRDVTDAPKFAAYGYEEHVGTYESPEPHPDITATAWIWSEQDRVKRWERTGFFVERTLDFLRRHARERPCFVNLWLDDPHTPWVPGEGAARGDTRENLRDVLVELDRQMGRLLDGLGELRIEERTLLVFTSDNGPLPTFAGARTAGLRGSKLSLYEGGLRMPLLVRWPGHVPAGRVESQTVLAAVDWLPTLAELAGVAPASSDGQSMRAALTNGPLERRQPLFWEYGRNEKSFAYPRKAGDRSPTLAVRAGRWKLLARDDGTGVELYDIEADPAETTNLVAREPDVAGDLLKQLQAWRQQCP